MAHFAYINDNNIVTQVIVIEQDMINTGQWGDPDKWIQTSYNTKEGIHFNNKGMPDGTPPLRKNFAGIGFTYDVDRDAFVPPKPYLSWVLNEESCIWEAPITYPNNKLLYNWDEDTLSWIEIK